MKKFLILTGIILVSFQSVSAFDGGFVNPGVFDAGAINARNMQMLRDQEFRRQEYNDAKSIQEVKEQHRRELEADTIKERPLFHKIINNGNSQFVQDEGKIKIENIQ